ncbi:MAG: CRISPR-associated endonuclease Cas1 [Pseudomonadota bacterium]
MDDAASNPDPSDPADHGRGPVWAALLAALHDGWARTQAGTPMAGADGQTVRAFSWQAESEIARLRRELEAGTYRPRWMLAFDIPKSSGGTRMLAVPAVRDRVVQGAALEVLGPRLEAAFEHVSYAYRPGRGVADAIRRIRHLREQGYRHVVDADIAAYFDRVDHDLLIERLREAVDEEAVLDLVRAWLTVEAVHVDGRKLARTEGLPQGSALSPLLANLFLDRLDEAMLARGYQLVRYADDFVVLARTERQAEAALADVEAVLAELELELHRGKTRVTSFDAGFRFLGHLFLRALDLPSDHPLPTAPSPSSASRPAPPSAPPAEASGATTSDAPTDTASGASESAPMPEVPPPPVLDREALSETSLGRALLSALDAEGVPLDTFSAALATPQVAPTEPPAEAEEPEPPLSSGASPEPLRLGPGTEVFRRTLYVQAPGAWVRVKEERFIITAQQFVDDTDPDAAESRDPAKRRRLEVPVGDVDQLVLLGGGLVTPAALRRCFRHGIAVHWCSARGLPYGHAEGTQASDPERLRLQVDRSRDRPFILGAARVLVGAKLRNSRALLQRYARRRIADGESDPVMSAVEGLGALLAKLDRASTLDAVRGYEGQGAALFFRAYGALLDGTAFTFTTRARRPPPDPVNALLSFGYTLLFQNVHALVRVHRLDPAFGTLHALRRGHPALASDLIEEFRFLVDRMVLALCTRGTLIPAHFERRDGAGPGIYLTEPGRKRFIAAFERAMLREVQHPDRATPVSYRRCIDLQVGAYVRHLEGTAPYVPFILTK